MPARRAGGQGPAAPPPYPDGWQAAVGAGPHGVDRAEGRLQHLPLEKQPGGQRQRGQNGCNLRDSYRVGGAWGMGADAAADALHGGCGGPDGGVVQADGSAQPVEALWGGRCAVPQLTAG